MVREWEVESAVRRVERGAGRGPKEDWASVMVIVCVAQGLCCGCVGCAPSFFLVFAAARQKMKAVKSKCKHIT